MGVQGFVSIVRKIASEDAYRASQAEAEAFLDGLKTSWGLEERFCLKYVLVSISARDASIRVAAGQRTFINAVRSAYDTGNRWIEEDDFLGSTKSALACGIS